MKQQMTKIQDKETKKNYEIRDGNRWKFKRTSCEKNKKNWKKH